MPADHIIGQPTPDSNLTILQIELGKSKDEPILRINGRSYDGEWSRLDDLFEDLNPIETIAALATFLGAQAGVQDANEVLHGGGQAYVKLVRTAFFQSYNRFFMAHLLRR